MGKDSSTKADAVQEGDWRAELESVSYTGIRHVANLHIYRKPSWAKQRSAFDLVEPVDYRPRDVAGGFWKAMVSVPMLVLLALPLLAVFAVTSFHYGVLPDSITPEMFKVAQSDSKSQTYLAGFWALALIAFVPWSSMMCGIENKFLKYFE